MSTEEQVALIGQIRALGATEIRFEIDGAVSLVRFGPPVEEYVIQAPRPGALVANQVGKPMPGDDIDPRDDLDAGGGMMPYFDRAAP